MPSGKDTPRSNCPIACALDLLGDRWTLVVLRDVLLDQRHTFSEIVAADGLRRMTNGSVVILDPSSDDEESEGENTEQHVESR